MKTAPTGGMLQQLPKGFTCLTIALLASLVPGFVATAQSTETNYTVRIQLLPAGSTAARVRVIGSDQKFYAPPDAIVRKTTREKDYFYADNTFAVSVPKGVTHFFFSAGLESIPYHLEMDVQSDGTIPVPINRWIDMRARGWYGGDSHIHLHTGGPLAVTVKDALVAARAEGLHYSNLCVSNNVGDDIRDASLITGKPHPLSTANHLLVFGEEMRSSIYGHMQFFGIRELVTPQYTGFLDTPNHHDYPANYTMAAEAVRQGGIVTYGHPMFKDQPLPFGDDLTADNGAARELPIDAILGVVQAIDLMSYNSDEDRSAELWYRLLNCGLKLAACVGTDALLDRSTDPLGGSRVYVQVDGRLTMNKWLAGLKQGRSLVTNGPIPQLTIAGKGPGETCQLKEQGTVQAHVNVESYTPFDRVDLIVNGKVVHTQKSSPNSGTNGFRLSRYDVDLPITRSSWVAVRVHGPDHPEIFDGPAWAHTSPVYLSLQQQPIVHREDAEYFVDWIGRLLRVVATRDRYAEAADRQRVEKLFQQAQQKFRQLAK
ncbi:MAG: CehA/McbA family metallohydrolase [Planctomycetota bacterium]|nr:CehA/McbA family metallohydrolase [Planctomycetota bacterium]